jgi:uncharacterized RDD family membrane protein YckC
MNPVHERTARFLNPVGRKKREIVTPEGVPLQVELADFGERLGAFLLDFLFIYLGIILLAITLGLVLSALGADPRITFTLILFLGFLIRTLYFVSFELAWRGATPGKRIVGLKVIDRRGGPLTQNAVVARNIMRELEAFLPLSAMLAVAGPGSAWEKLALAGWLLLFALLPLFNRDRMRGGDLLAGTMVVALPKRRLVADLVQATERAEFTDQQLRAYGAFELQVLEELLRRPDNAETVRLRQDVCSRVCRKIGWQLPVPPGEVLDFLRRFYTAERAFLERAQLYGRPVEDKTSAGGGA